MYTIILRSPQKSVANLLEICDITHFVPSQIGSKLRGNWENQYLQIYRKFVTASKTSNLEKPATAFRWLCYEVKVTRKSITKFARKLLHVICDGFTRICFPHNFCEGFAMTLRLWGNDGCRKSLANSHFRRNCYEFQPRKWLVFL